MCERQLFEVPTTEVHATKVRLTFIDGEKVFDAASPPKLTAHQLSNASRRSGPAESIAE